MDLIQRRQAAVMNQHYQRYSLDYFLDAQQRIGFTSIELWCGAQHFWLDDQHYDDVQSLLRKVQRRGLEVVSLTCPSFCFQYQYAPFSPEVADYCLSYFKKGLAVAEDLGCTVMTVNSGWGCMDRPRQESWNASCELLRQLAEEGMTMLVVTHEMGFARNVSSKTVFMENGVVVEQAPSREFFEEPKEERTREFLRKIEHTN